MEVPANSDPNPPATPVALQTAIGDNNVQVLLQNVHGSPVNIDARPRVRPMARPLPVRYPPPPFPGLLDRETEQRTLTGFLRAHKPVNIHGSGGQGKTVLLQATAHHPTPGSDPFPAGMVYLSARAQPLTTVEDVLEALYELFFDYPGDYKPTRGEIRSGLQDKQALVLLDDLPLARQDVEALLNVAPGCTFLFVTEERQLWGRGRDLALQGLPPDAALELVERELGRPLADAERTAARELCDALRGHPLHLLQAAAQARETGRSIAEPAAPTRAPLVAQLVDALPEPERRVLAALALVDGAPLSQQQLADLTGLIRPEPAIATLMRRGFVQAHSPRYSLTGDWAETLRQRWNLTPDLAPALTYFASWAEARADDPRQILESAGALLELLAQAVEAQRWGDVLRLGRAVGVAFAAGRRWGAWARVLHWILRAARALGDGPAEGWALHQIGTRALCLNQPDLARARLTEALRLRETIGDREGAAVTRHNLSFLGGPPAPPRRTKPSGRVPPLVWVLVAALVIGLLAVTGVVVAVRFWPQPTPVVPPPPPPTIEVATVEPEVSIELDGGCDRAYAPLQQVEVAYQANVRGWVTVTVDDRVVSEEHEVEAGRTYREALQLPREAGEHLLTASLDTGARIVFDRCAFVVGQVPAPGPQVLFDFVAAAPQATWRSNAGDLAFGAPDDRGFALWEDAAVLENSDRFERVLVTQPYWDDGGYVIGIYQQTERIALEATDRFVARIGFVDGADAGSVEVQLRFSDVCEFSEFFLTVGTTRKAFDGRLAEWSMPLAQLTGQRGCFALRVSAAGDPQGDQLAWIEARLERP